jgi:hypothetical protein
VHRDEWLALDPRRHDNDHLRGYHGETVRGIEVRWNPGTRELYTHDTRTGEVEVLSLVRAFDDDTPLALHHDHLRHEALALHAKTLAEQHGVSVYFPFGRDQELQLSFGRPEMYEGRGGIVSSDLFTPTTTDEIDAALREFLRERSPDKVELDPNSHWSKAADMAWEDAVEWQLEQDRLQTEGEYDDDRGPDIDDDTFSLVAQDPETGETYTCTYELGQVEAPAAYPIGEPADSQPVTATGQPEAVRVILDRLAGLAPNPDEREERTLAELHRLEAVNDPVRRLEGRYHHLETLTNQANTPGERDALAAELAAARADLRAFRRAQAVDRALGHYMADALTPARLARVATVIHDAFTTQPAWVVDHVRHLHDTGRLTPLGLGEIAVRIGEAATHQDLHGQLPASWPELPAPARAPEMPAPEVG